MGRPGYERAKRLNAASPQAASHKPLACFCLLHQGRWPQAGGGLFVWAQEVWEVVRYVVRGALYVVGGWNRARHALWRIKSLPQATGHKPRAGFKNPHPGPPPRGGRVVLRQPSRGSKARRGPRIKSGTRPGSRVLSTVGRGLVCTFSLAQYQLPGRDWLYRPRSEAYSGREATARLP